VVLALGDGRFKSVRVQPGRMGERRVEILSGLKEGERIVTSAQFLIDSESSKTSDFMRMEPHGGHGDRP
jgi:Cu(I)/Ag(I) efflux system membrane fusion protein